MSIASTVNTMTTWIDTAFNALDSIPVVSLATSPYRILAGTVQAVAGAVIYGTVYLAKDCFTKEQMPILHEIVVLSDIQLLFGCNNVIRGIGELILAYTIVGSLLVLGYEIVTCADKPHLFAPTILFAPELSYEKLWKISIQSYFDCPRYDWLNSI